MVTQDASREPTEETAVEDVARDSIDRKEGADRGVSDGGPGGSDVVNDGGGQTTECLAKPGLREYRIILRGTGFDAYEGMSLKALTTDGQISPCRATGTIRIEAGAFEIELVNVGVGLYPTIDAFIDLGNDGACSDSVDPTWHVSTVLTANPRQIDLTPARFSVSGTCVF